VIVPNNKDIGYTDFCYFQSTAQSLGYSVRPVLRGIHALHDRNPSDS